MRVRLALGFGCLLMLTGIGLILLRLSDGRVLSQPTRTTNNLSGHKVTYHPQLPGLNEIFSADHAWIATLSGQRRRTLLVTGDVIPARMVNYQAIVKYKDSLWPWRKTADILRQADVTLINLETPLLANCPAEISTAMIFCGNVNNLAGLQFAGVDMVSLANNHMGDYGVEGTSVTKRLLETAGISVTGADGPVYTQVRHLRFGFLAYNAIGAPEKGISWADPEKISQQIATARKNADVVIVMFHWGTEYQEQPDKTQQSLAHLAIDAGADLVLGNHPHWIEPVEIFKGKLIAYAHGNFIFDQEWSEKTKEGVVGEYSFYDKALVDVQFLPVRIMDYGQPYFLTGKEKGDVLAEMERASLVLQASSSPQLDSRQWQK